MDLHDWIERAARTLSGIGGPTAPVEELDLRDWTRVIEVNLTGTFLVTQAAMPHRHRSPNGSIDVMSSPAGPAGSSLCSAYCASKWAFIGLTKTLAIELGGFGIRAKAALPGAVAGPAWGGPQRPGRSCRTVAGGRPAGAANQSIREFVTAEEVAPLVVYLWSDSARRISGRAFLIDGDSQSTQ